MSAKKKKVTKEQWENTIRKARQYVREYSTARWVICDLAREVCDTSHGGRKGESVYSIAQFAKAIELNRKTLYQWIRVKSLVFDKLPKGIRDNSKKYNYEDFDTVSNRVAEDSSAAEVKRAWYEHMAQPPESRKFEKYIKHLNAIIYNVSRPMIMKDIEEHLIQEVIDKSNLIRNLAEKELEFRVKYPKGQTALKKRLNMREELEGRIVKAASADDALEG